MANLNDAWIILGSNYFRRLNIYKFSFGEPISFNDHFITACGNGGKIAFLQFNSAAVGKPILKITTSSGQTVFENKWKDAEPIAISWSNDEELVVVQKSGYVTMLTQNGVFKRRFSFGKEAEDKQIVEAKFFDYENHTAVACRTGSSRIFIATSLERPRILAVAELPKLVNSFLLWQIVTSPPSIDSDSIKAPWVLVNFSKQFFRVGVGSCRKVEYAASNFNSFFTDVLLMSVSPNENLLALYLDTHILWVGSTDLTQKDMEFDLKSRVSALLSTSDDTASRSSVSILAVTWLDDSTLVLQYKNFLVLVDIKENIYEFFYPSYVYTQFETDRIRVITPTTYELIQRVPHELEMLGCVGSSCPAALLLSAYKNWENCSGRSHDFIRPIESVDKMYTAVTQSLSAACHLTLSKISSQKSVLQAACFGRGFLSYLITSSNQSSIVDSNKMDDLALRVIEIYSTLRFLNNLAAPWIAVPITWSQYQKLGPLALLNLLLARGHFPMCIELVSIFHKHSSVFFPDESKSLKTLGMTRILSTWVSRLPTNSDVGASLDVCMRKMISVINRIANSKTKELQLGNNRNMQWTAGCVVPWLSFSDVASVAVENGHRNLAEKLLELEPRTRLEIPMLLKLKKYNIALTRAVESGDSDLLLKVLLALQDQTNVDSTALSMLLRQHPTALAFYREHLEIRSSSASETERRISKATSQALSVLLQEDDPASKLKKEVINAFNLKTVSLRSSALQKARNSYHQIQQEFLSEVCDDSAKLINFHQKLEQQRIAAPLFSFHNPSSNNSITGNKNFILPVLTGDKTGSTQWQMNSINLTYVRLIVGRQERLAEQLCRDFKIPEKRVAYLRLIGLALTNDGWPEIQKMTLLKKPLVPLEKIVKVYLDAGQSRAALELIQRLPNMQRIPLLVSIGQTREAISVALQDKTGEQLYMIQRLIFKTDKTLYDEISQLRSQLV